MWNYVFFSITITVISLVCHYNLRKSLSIVNRPKSRYDYIVVGAGTAGCVVASRLSEDTNSTVLLIEAGGYFNWMSTIPLAAPLMQGSSVDWSYKTEPQFYSSAGFHDNQQSWPRGKGLGGSGQMNYLVHSFGRPEDFVGWPSEWSYAKMQPYFKKVANMLHVKSISKEYDLMKAFFESAQVFDDEDVVFWKPATTINDGARWSSYSAYLKQAWNRGNLNILMKTMVTNLVLDLNDKVEGVEVKYEDESTGFIEVQKSVILCAGTINTPQLLMVSGIGPRGELERHNITVKLDLPPVGQNLFDHFYYPIYVNLKSPVSITLKKIQTLFTVLNYLLHGNGYLSFNGIMGMARVNHSSVMMCGMGSTDEKVLRDIANYKTETFRSMFPAYKDSNHEGFLYLASCWQPKSRGNITLRSNNIFDAPRIDPAYLENDEDVSCTHEAIKLALRTLESPLFRHYGATAHIPKLKDCQHLNEDYFDKNYAECALRTAGMTNYHPAGACRMSLEDDGVVDQYLRVKGVERLRIMDASILPSPISGMPNSVIVALAERAVDLIQFKEQNVFSKSPNY